MNQNKLFKAIRKNLRSPDSVTLNEQFPPVAHELSYAGLTDPIESMTFGFQLSNRRLTFKISQPVEPDDLRLGPIFGRFKKIRKKADERNNVNHLLFPHSDIKSPALPCGPHRDNTTGGLPP